MRQQAHQQAAVSSLYSISQVLGLPNCYENSPSSQAKQTPPPILFYTRVKRNNLPQAKRVKEFYEAASDPPFSPPSDS